MENDEMHFATISIGTISWILVSGIVFVCVLKALTQSEIFSGATRWVLAICTTSLAMIGLLGSIAPGNAMDGKVEARGDGSLFHAITFPYAAMALAMVAVVLMLLASRIGMYFRNFVEDENQSRPSDSEIVDDDDRTQLWDESEDDPVDETNRGNAYHVCSACNAKWFDDVQASTCPRCGSSALWKTKGARPWARFSAALLREHDNHGASA
jgi:predicted RNA-binding Zn-ribbon protein involved in translation (DUF1610 family)